MAADIEQIGFCHYEWEARGVLCRAMDCGSYILLPTGHSTVVGRGVCWTARGARRRAERALRYWCHDPASTPVGSDDE